MRARARAMRVALAAACGAALVATERAAAQAEPTGSSLFAPAIAAARAPLDDWQVPPASGSARWAPPLLSLALPGAGQHALGQRRKWAYLALEVAGWAFWLERRGSAREARDRYRDLAWEAGRLQGPVRVDGDFSYYETLSKWTRSGAYDADVAAPGVQPEPDDATYNGSIWSLASQIFLGGGPVPETDPAYLMALAYYADRAYGPDLLWDWTGAPDQQAEVRRLIERSDDRFRQATTALGIVIANHLLAAGDAYFSSRGRIAPVRVRIVPHALAGRSVPALAVSVPFE